MNRVRKVLLIALMSLSMGNYINAQIFPVYFTDVIKEGDKEILHFEWRADSEAYARAKITDADGISLGEVNYPKNTFNIQSLRAHKVLFVTALGVNGEMSDSVRVEIDTDYSGLYYHASAMEQIIVDKQTGGNASFIKSGSGEEFIAKGGNFCGIRLGDHDTFEPDIIATQGHVTRIQAIENPNSFLANDLKVGDTIRFYDPYRTETLMRTLKSNGYNMVRVFMKTGGRGSTTTKIWGMSGPSGTEGLYAPYMDNFIDFLIRAQRYGIYVMPCFTENEMMDNAYFRNLSQGASGQAILFSEDGIKAKQHYLELFLEYIREVNPDLISTLFALTMQNEFAFHSYEAPFDQLSGTYTFLDGNTYDMTDNDQRRALANAAIQNYYAAMKETINIHAPGLLMGEGTFAMGAVGKTYDNSKGIRPIPGNNDLRFPMTAVELLNTDLDFLDFHIYRWGVYGSGADVFNHFARNMKVFTPECANLMQSKPVIMAEFGSFKANESSIGAALKFTSELREAALEYGFKGSCFWTVNTFEQTRLWNLMWNDGAIMEASDLNFSRPISDDFLLEFDAIVSADCSDFYIKPPLGDAHQDDYFQLRLKFEEGNISLFNEDYSAPAGLPAADGYVTDQKYNFRIYMDSSSMKQRIMYKTDTETVWTVLFDEVSWANGYTPVGRIELPQDNLSLSNVKTSDIYSLAFMVNDGENAIEGASVILDGDTLYSDISGNVIFSNKTSGTYNYTITAIGFGQTSSKVFVDGQISDTVSLDVNSNYSFSPMTDDFVLEFDAIALANWSDFYIKPPKGDAHQDDYYQMNILFGGGDITLFNDDFQTGLVADGGYALNQAYNFRIYMDSSSLTQTVLYKKDTDLKWTVLFEDVGWVYGYTPAGRIVLPQNNLSLSNIKTSRIYSVFFEINDKIDPYEGATVILDGDTLTTDTAGYVVFPDKVFGTYNYAVFAEGFESAEGRVTVYNDHISKTVSLSEISEIARYDFTPMTTAFLLEFDLIPLLNGSDFYVKPPMGDPHQDDYFQTWLKFKDGKIYMFNGDHQPPKGLVAAEGYELLQKYSFRIYLYPVQGRLTVMYKTDTETEWTELFVDEIWSYGYTPVGRIFLPDAGLEISNITVTPIEEQVSIEPGTANEKLEIYPNPVEEEFFISSVSDIESIKVFSASGNLLKINSSPDGNEASVNTSAFESGLYFLQVGTKKGVVVKQFVKK